MNCEYLYCTSQSDHPTWFCERAGITVSPEWCRKICRHYPYKIPDNCEYLDYADLAYSSWWCSIAEGVVSQDFCRKICRYCPQKDIDQDVMGAKQ